MHAGRQCLGDFFRMNFFERQDIVRRQSKRLVFLFLLAVLAIVGAIDLLLVIAFSGFGEGHDPAGALVLATVLTIAVITCASMFRMASLRKGGAAVAHELGATPVPENTSDPQLRRLRNVVEEIAIASGVPVPQIFVLDEEDAINAFAAGYTASDAAVTVTRGALNTLNRDELQGVIAHEFSHVINGDMRLNIRLIGLLFGILVLALIGRKILENGRFRGKGAGGILGVAIGLMLIGYIGLFFGRLIKAGVSRQREFLADASAVQFTRQTRGITGALKKVGGLAAGSKLATSDAEEVSHMLFGDGIGYSALMATHPPLIKRIQALEPGFKDEALAELSARWQMKAPVGMDEDFAMGLTGDHAGSLPSRASVVGITAPAVVAQMGTPQPHDYEHAGDLNEAIPELLRAAVRQHDQVMPLMFGLLIGYDEAVRSKQRFELKARMGEAVALAAIGFADQTNDLHPMLRLPLAALAFPLLRRRPRPELQQFMDSVYALVHADGQVDLFEYCLGNLLRTQVSEALDPSRAWKPGSRRLADVTTQAVTLFAVIAQSGHDHPTDALRAYLAGLAHVFPRLNAPYTPPTDATGALDEVLPVLDLLEPYGKELLIEGLVVSISSDGRIAVAEAELLRTVCACLHCPLPPLLEAATPRA
jgi:Zn-dependent protease with chaperone function